MAKTRPRLYFAQEHLPEKDAGTGTMKSPRKRERSAGKSAGKSVENSAGENAGENAGESAGDSAMNESEVSPQSSGKSGPGPIEKKMGAQEDNTAGTETGADKGSGDIMTDKSKRPRMVKKSGNSRKAGEVEADKASMRAGTVGKSGRSAEAEKAEKAGKAGKARKAMRGQKAGVPEEPAPAQQPDVPEQTPVEEAPIITAARKDAAEHPLPPPTGASPERAATGIPGFDALIEGGLKRKSVTLVEGCAGSGKSTFAIQFIYDGITRSGEPGLYVTFEEDKDDFYDNMMRYGWDLKALEKKGRFAFIRYTPEQVAKLLKTGGGVIRDIVVKIKAKRIVIDSISSFNLLHPGELERKSASLDLFRMLRRWGCTSLVIGESQMGEEDLDGNSGEFEVDGIVWLHNFKKEEIRVRAIEVFKMRGTKHATRTFPFEITETGIVIYPEQSVF
jgi:circadian clock protein KaiC